VRDKAVASLAKFLSAGAKKDVAEGEEEETLEVGALEWEKEWEVDTRLAPLEMAKLWKGIFFCTSHSSATRVCVRVCVRLLTSRSPPRRLLDVG
jgi:hypothetical protein